MQDLTPLIKEGKKQIETYGNGGFTISGEKIQDNIIILPDSVHRLNSRSIADVTIEDLKMIADNSSAISILLVGCGQRTEFFNDEVEAFLRTHHINIEYMDTGAAARTYNILLGEERKVAVLLIAV